MSGPDLGVLVRVTTNVLQKMKQTPGAVDVDSSLITGKPELTVTVDRDRAADLGVQVLDVTQALQLLVGGQDVSTYSENGEEYDVRLRAARDFRVDPDALALMTVPSRRLGQVSFSDVVKLADTVGPSTIDRYQRQRQVTLMANAAPGYSEATIGDAMLDAIRSENLPPGTSVAPTGQAKFMKQTAISFGAGLLLAMVFMYQAFLRRFRKSEAHDAGGDEAPHVVRWSEQGVPPTTSRPSPSPSTPWRTAPRAPA